MISTGEVLGSTVRFIRANPRALVIWSIASVAAGLLLRLLVAGQAASAGGPHDAPSSSFLIFASILVLVPLYVALPVAVFRAVLFPEQRSFGYLRLGMDELRVLGVSVVLMLAYYALMFVAGIAVGIMVVAFQVGGAGGATLMIGLIVIGLAMFVASAVFFVRLMPALPLTFLRRKIVIGPAWRLTRGSFWPLLGSAVTVGFVAAAILIVFTIISMGPAFAALLHPGDPAALAQIKAYEAQAGQLTPSLLILTLVGGMLGAILLAAQAGSLAIATLMLVDEHQES